MTHDPQSWQRIAEAARRAPDPPSDGPRPIPWLSDLEPRVRAAFLRLLWRRAALWAVLIAASVYVLVLWRSSHGAVSDDTGPPAPTLPLPPLP